MAEPDLLRLQGVNKEEVCRNHLVLGQHLYQDLEGRDFNLYGGGKLRVKANKVTSRFLQNQNQNRVILPPQKLIGLSAIDHDSNMVPAGRLLRLTRIIKKKIYIK